MRATQEFQCSVCAFHENDQKTFKHLRRHEQWDLYECPQCTFQFWWPMEQASQEWWEDTYRAFRKPTIKPNLEPRHRVLLRNLPLRYGRILDMGCGEGAFIYEMSRRGFDVYGVDVNAFAIEKCKKLFGLKNVYHSSLYDLPNLPNFHLITFFEVLEHIGDPKRLIGAVRSRLSDRGLIALTVPNARSYGAWEERINVPPHHLTRWDVRTIKRFVVRNSFEILSIRTINRLDSHSFLMNLLPLKNYPISNRHVIRAWRYASFIPREILYFLNFRSTIFVIARMAAADSGQDCR